MAMFVQFVKVWTRGLLWPFLVIFQPEKSDFNLLEGLFMEKWPKFARF
jgi:hypothetical protein